MASVRVTQTLPVDPQTAWDNLSNLAEWQNWLSLHQSWKGQLPADLTVGTQVTEVLSVMGMTTKVEWTFTELDAPNTVTIEGLGMAGVKVRFVLSVAPAGVGSAATIHADFGGAMIVGPIGKAVGRSAQSDLKKSLVKFAELIAA